MKKFCILLLICFFAISSLKAQFTSAEIQSALSQYVQISMVTVDTATWRNLLIWQSYSDSNLMRVYPYFSNLSIDNYSIYQYNDSLGTYNNIGVVPATNASVFLDTSSRPNLKSYKYKIAVSLHYSLITNPTAKTTITSTIDSCKYHKTLFIQKQVSGDSLTFNIEPYKVEGLNITSLINKTKVYIFRSTDSLNLFQHLYDSVSFKITDTIFQYVDHHPNKYDTLDYYAGVVFFKVPVNPALYDLLKISEGPYSMAISNLEDNRMKADTTTAIQLETSRWQQFSVTPNPITSQSQIKYTLNNDAQVKLEFVNSNGVVLEQLVNHKQQAGDYIYQVPLTEYNSGEYYLVVLTVNNKSSSIKVIKP